MPRGRVSVERRIENFDTEPTYENETFGDEMSEKQEVTLRIISQNINGLLKQENYHKLKLEKQHIENTNYDIMAIQETNVNWKKRGTRRNLNRTLDVFKPIRQTHSHCTSYDKKTFHQPGGTSTITRNLTAKKDKTYETDELGRWNINIINFGYQDVYIINIYRPLKRGNNGIKSVWQQQITHFQQQERNIRNPRHQFDEDLKNTIEKIKSLTQNIIIIGDFNEPETSNEQGNTLLEMLGLINILKYRHSTQLPKTHINGSRAIDHIWLTPNLLPHIRSTGMLPFDSIFKSYQRTLFLDITLQGFQQTTNAPIIPRRLTTNNTNSTTKYIKSLRDLLTEKRINEKIHEIRRKLNINTQIRIIHNEIEQLDKEITECMLRAERTCSTIKPSTPYSPQLIQSRNLVRYWQTIHHLTTNNIALNHSELSRINPQHDPLMNYTQDLIREKKGKYQKELNRIKI